VKSTAEVIRRFNDAFQRHDASALEPLIAQDCVLENTQPAPNGARYVGREACTAFWRNVATTPGTHFVLEETIVLQDRDHPLALLLGRRRTELGPRRQFDARARRSDRRGTRLRQGRNV